FEGYYSVWEIGAPLAKAPDTGNPDMTSTSGGNGSRRPARWNVISVCAPFVGLLFGVVAAGMAPHMQQGVWGFRVWFVCAVLGFLAGLNAVARGERWWGVTVVGFLLNLAVLAVTWGLVVEGF